MNYRSHIHKLMASTISIVMAFSPIATEFAVAQATTSNQAADADWEKEFSAWRAASKANTKDQYEAYLKAYPAGKFAKVAKSRIEHLTAAANPVKTDDKPADQASTDAKTEPADDTAQDTSGTTAGDQNATDTAAADDAGAAAEDQAQIAKPQNGLKQPPSSADNVTAGNATDDAAGTSADDTATSDQAQADDQAAPADDQQAQADDQATDDQAANDQAQADDQATAPAGQDDNAAWQQEFALWQAAAQGNTVPEYEAYLKVYPEGQFAAIAKSRISALAAAEKPASNIAEGDETGQDQMNAANADDQDQGQPVDDQGQDQAQADDQGQDQAPVEEQDGVAADDQGGTPQTAGKLAANQLEPGDEATEADVLDREARVEMQGRLDSLGFEVGAPDGAFGPRTRAAIAEWQESNGIPATGFFSGDQVDFIREQSETSYAEWLKVVGLAAPVVTQRLRNRVVVEQPVVVHRVRPRVVIRPGVVVRPRVVIRPRVVVKKRCFVNRKGRFVCRRF